MFVFGDSFDLYAAVADMTLGYWDSSSGTLSALVTGRFAGSRALQLNNSACSLTKSSGSNDTVHHIICSIQQGPAISGSTLGTYFQFIDGSTNQCCIVFR